jgi:hypothetical protein
VQVKKMGAPKSPGEGKLSRSQKVRKFALRATESPLFFLSILPINVPAAVVAEQHIFEFGKKMDTGFFEKLNRFRFGDTSNASVKSVVFHNIPPIIWVG